MRAAAVYDAEAFSTSAHPKLHSLLYLLGHVGLAVFHVLACPLRSRRRHPHWKTYVLEKVCPHVYSAFAYGSFTFGWSGKR